MTDTDDKPQAEDAATTEPATTGYNKLIKQLLPLLVPMLLGGGALQQSQVAQEKGQKAWKLSAPTVNRLIDRVEAGDAERLVLTKELAVLRGILSAKGLIPTSRADVAGSAKPVLLEDKGGDAPPKKEPVKKPKKPEPKKPKKPEPKPKKPPIKKLPTVLVA